MIPNFKDIRLVVCDFDGVMTDNKVLVDENMVESVVCNRGDGVGIELLKKNGIDVVVVSKERNTVVKARCDKLSVPVWQGVDDKVLLFRTEIKKRGLSMGEVCYIGNDINDLDCIKEAGIGIAVADSHKGLLKAADFVTEKKGGDGAVREICDMILDEHKPFYERFS